jgi:signal transduction histidine kinase
MPAAPATDGSSVPTRADEAPNLVGAGHRPRRERPSLLVVDDEPEVLTSIHDLLRLEYRVITRGSGAGALEVLRSAETIHAVMSDQRMPGMSGVDLLQEAKAIRPETTRLLFTAHADIRAVIDAINHGHVFRYLAKPWDPEELRAVVRQAVEHHDLIVEKNRLLAELRAANARLTEADRLKGAFLEVASHELNTPVSVILGLIELRRIASGEAAAADRPWIDRIGAAAWRLARTVERMLKLVRSGEFGRSLERQPVALDPLLRRAVDELSPYLELRRQSVAIEIDSDLGLLDLDADKIADVLINLLANAVKFTPDGGTIRVAAAAEPGAPGWVRVSVRDEGTGVPADDQQYLFEPFFTGFDTLRHSSGDYQFGKRGLGLGLWLVKTFVEMHGGRVEVSSSHGRGSTFSFLLPRGSGADSLG